MKKLPKLSYPLNGYTNKYTIYIADRPGSSTMTYMLYGAWIFGEPKVEIVVTALKIVDQHILVNYVTKADNKAHETYANGIKLIKQRVSKVSADKEPTLEALHYVATMYIRIIGKKTFEYKAFELDKRIRGASWYTINDVNQTEDGRIRFTVSQPNYKPFDVTAKYIARGQWHMEDGCRRPIPGPDPSEA